MGTRKKLSYVQKSCIGKAGKLMHSAGMLWPGARLGIAFSGGVDSWALLQILRIYRKRLPFPIELMALHINPGFAPENHLPLAAWLQENGIPAHLECLDIGPRAHTSENRTNSPCFWCSLKRRQRLFQLCQTYNLTHLAFGHTSDDLVQTFFMNMTTNGRIEGMYPKESFFKGSLEVIRPLLWIDKFQIQRAAKAWNLPIVDNPCPSAHNSRRSDVEHWLENLWAGDKRIRKNIVSALRRWQQFGPHD
ncbi:MAG: tRNA lysidine(34) synthetase [Thermodesulfobacteriota bacterium]